MGARTWGRSWLGRVGAALALVSATAVAAVAVAPAPSGDGWNANPDDQFLLDVRLHQYRLGDGVRAYQTPEGTCIIFGDFLTTLDVPMKIDLAARKASGWAFQESNRITIDEGAARVEYGKKSEVLARNTIHETPEGWCVDSAALTRWFGIGVKPVMSGSVLLLQTDQKLPVELAMEREQRAKNLHPAKVDLSSLPQVRLPYLMWRTPALDFVVSGGVTYLAGSGTRVDREASVYAAGEIAHLSYDAQLTTSQTGSPSELRLRAYRSDPNANLLGPLHATNFGVGDVTAFEDQLTGTPLAGRGAVVTNRPLTSPTAFGRKTFEGDLPSGWEAELYRNGQLIAFAKSDSSQRYTFSDVQLLYGDNEIKIVLYGPQGQVRTEVQTVNVGEENVPPGKTWYWVGFNEPGRDLINFQQQPATSTALPLQQGTVDVEHGLDDRTTVGVLARTLLFADQRVTYVEGTVRRSIGPALMEVSASRDSGGGTAAEAHVLGKFGSINIDAQALVATDFHLDGQEPAVTRRDLELEMDTPIHIGRTVLPAHADLHLTKFGDGSSQLDAAAALSANIDRFNLSADVDYRRTYLAHGPAPPPQILADLIGSGSIGNVRLRGSTEFETSPSTRLRIAELDAYWSSSPNVDWEGTLAYDASEHRGRALVSHINRFKTMALAITGEAATDGSFAIGFNLDFSLDPRHGLDLSREPLAGAGVVHAHVFQDLNGNGVWDPGEPNEKGALVTTGTMLSPKGTDSHGNVTIGGLTSFVPVAVGVDTTSLADPMLTPKEALQVAVPRPGVAASIEIPLEGAGDIEGAIVKSGGVGFEGLQLELVNSKGKVIDSTVTDFDGFFLFDRVSYGSYTVRVAKASAGVAHISQELNAHATVTPDRSVARLGTIQVTSNPKIASAQ